jgi:hypothetical protein
MATHLTIEIQNLDCGTGNGTNSNEHKLGNFRGNSQQVTKMATNMSDEKQQNDTPTSIRTPPNDRRQLADLYEDASIDPAYQAKARILNRAIEEIGMGKYQVGPMIIV